MGKLHTLRRSIERDPGSWFVAPRWDKSKPIVLSARHHSWCWGRNVDWMPEFGSSYTPFVRSVLKQLGKI